MTKGFKLFKESDAKAFPSSIEGSEVCASTYGLLAFGYKGKIFVRRASSDTHHTEKQLSPKAEIRAMRFFNLETNSNFLLVLGKEFDQNNLFLKIVEVVEEGKSLVIKEHPNIPILPEETSETIEEINGFEINDADTLIAIALHSKSAYYGTVLLYECDLRTSKYGVKYLNRINVSGSKVTGIGLHRHEHYQYTLFISTNEGIGKCLISSSTGNKSSVLMTEKNGCPRQCSYMHHERGEFTTVNGQNVAIHKENVVELSGGTMGEEVTSSGKSRIDIMRLPDGREPVKISQLGAFLILVSKSSGRERYVTVYGKEDDKTFYKAYEKQFEQGVENVLVEEKRKQIFIICKSNITRIEEKDITAKLEVFSKKYEFNLAIKEAEEYALLHSNDTYVVEMKQKHADYLFSQGKVDTAVKHYCELIGQLEPSYVIRKLLEAKENHHLITYLEEIHKNVHQKKFEGRKKNSFTKLLLFSYSRMKQETDKSTFFENHSPKTSSSDANSVDPITNTTSSTINAMKKLGNSTEDVAISRIKAFLMNDAIYQYDKITAIKALRQIGYREIALELAESSIKSRKTEEKIEDKKDGKEEDDDDIREGIDAQNLVITIHIEDFHDDKNPAKHYMDALRHIEKFPSRNVEELLKVYAKDLITRLPRCTTNLLIRLCTRTFVPMNDNSNKESRKVKEVEAPHSSESFTSDTISKFIYSYGDQRFWLMVFLENLVYRIMGDPSFILPTTVYNTLIELYLRYRARNLKTIDFSKADSYEKLYNLLEIDSDDNYIQSNNILAESKVDNDPDYAISPPSSELLRMTFDEKVMEILRTQYSSVDEKRPLYDTEHVLMLLEATKNEKVSEFDDAKLHLYQNLNLRYDIMQHYMKPEKRAYDEILKLCEKETDPNFWVQVLSYFSNCAPSSENGDVQFDEAFDEAFDEVLKRVEENDILPPLQVIQILSSNEKTKLSRLKNFLKSKLSKELNEIKELSEKTKVLQENTAKLHDDIEELRTSAKVFQLTTCSSCMKQLDLPAVHFMCMHSYHQRCLDDDFERCKKCFPKNEKAIEKSKRIHMQEKNPQEAFFSQLESSLERSADDLEEKSQSSDGFNVVAKYFGLGLFKKDIFEKVFD